VRPGFQLRTMRNMTHRMINLEEFPFDARFLPSNDAYVACFQNQYGEQMFFIAEPGAKTAHVLHEDLPPEPLSVVGGLLLGFCLDMDETVFIGLCWQASKFHRYKGQDMGWADDTVRDEMDAEPRVILQAHAVLRFGSCWNCSQRVGLRHDDVWFHADFHGRLHERSCRAASYRRLGDYDAALRKNWSAECD
jgi:hypothetical protein